MSLHTLCERRQRLAVTPSPERSGSVIEPTQGTIINPPFQASATDQPNSQRHPSPDSRFSHAKPDEAVLGQYIPLLYHYNMLQDEDRVGAFLRAIEYLVKPGMHVVELGGGTGILSSFAARCGAQVTCVERNPELVERAQHFVRLNELAHQVTVVQADAQQYVPDRPVDVVVCEMLHVGLLREKQAQVIDAFKRNYLRAFDGPLPTLIPEVSILMAQPIQQNFDFAGYHAPVPMFQAPLLNQPRTCELAPLTPYCSLAYHEPIPLQFHFNAEITLNRAGLLNAIRLVTQNVLTIDMQAESAITWPNQCLVLPIDVPLEAQESDRICIRFAYPAGGSIEELSASLSVQFGS